MTHCDTLCQSLDLQIKQQCNRNMTIPWCRSLGGARLSVWQVFGWSHKKRKTISTTVEASQTLGEVGILGQVHR